MNREPILIGTIVQILLTGAVTLGMDLTAEQLSAFVAVLIAIFGWLSSSQVWSKKSIELVTGVPEPVAEERLKLEKERQ